MQIRMYMGERDQFEEQLRAMVDEALRQTGVEGAEIEVVRVKNDDEAKELRSLGSPTIRVDGFDIEYAEREPPETTSGARYYSTPAGWQRMPEPGMVVFAIKEAQQRAARRG